MVNNLEIVLEEIEVLRNRMNKLYLQKRSLQSLVGLSKKLDHKLNIHQKLMRLK
jgi:hypothetical protein